MSGLRRVIVGISGASGAVLGMRTLELLHGIEGVESHVVISRSAQKTLEIEIGGYKALNLEAPATVVHDVANLAASIASGSFQTHGMIIAPCSMRTLSAVAYALSDNLLIRAAEVTLKERRPLVLLTREAPLHAAHLKSMLRVTNLGGIILPPVPAFYTRPTTVDQIATQIAARAIALVGLDPGNAMARWGEQQIRTDC